MNRIVGLCALLAVTTGCQVLNESSNGTLADGRYRTGGARHWVEVAGDTLYTAPEAKTTVTTYPPELPPSATPPTLHLARYSLETGILTVPVKLRAPVGAYVGQLNPSFNANLYVGLRREWHTIGYRRSPIRGRWVREDAEWALSLGVFTGISQDFINPWNSDPPLEVEYDGIVWQNGAVLLVDYHWLTTGLAIGFDHLTDGNRQNWVFERRPWVGAVFGFNFN